MRSKVAIVMIALLLPLSARAQDAGEELLAAARKGDIEKVRALLDRSVDVNSKSRYGATALSFASEHGYLEIVRLLVERGADVNVRDTFYNSDPATWAAIKGHTEIVSLLLDKGARGRDQILLMGVQGEKPALVKVVLEKGGLQPATLTQALSMAERQKQTEIIEMLKAAGAKPGPKADFKLDSDTMKSYAGSYKNDQVGEIVIGLKDDKLTLTIAGQPTYTLGAFDKTTFRIMEVEGIQIKFKVESDKATGFTLTQSGLTFEFKKAGND
ncbi:MAG: ankyrin repeat domain-containing protein [Acidobacteriota bacterium]